MTSCELDLGRTSALHDPSDNEGLTLTWITYWKNLEGLQAFAASTAHRFGEINYQKKKYPFLGVMHETFHAPKGCWETINYNMPPWGLAKIADRLGTLRQTTSESRHSNMFSRMHNNQAIAELRAKSVGKSEDALYF